MIALAIGVVLAVVALGFVLYPMFFSKPGSIDDQIEAAVRAYREQPREQKHDRCAACGTPVGARDARYCSNCGKRLPA
jgi:hypothetical protein